MRDPVHLAFAALLLVPFQLFLVKDVASQRPCYGVAAPSHDSPQIVGTAPVARFGYAQAPRAATTPQNPSKSSEPETAFETLKRWKNAVLAGDRSALQGMYSADPAPTLGSPAGKSHDAKKEVEFWASLKASGLRSMKFAGVKLEALRPEIERTIFELEFAMESAKGSRTLYASVGQVWMKQGAEWRIVASQRTDLARLRQPTSTDADLYPPVADANANIQAALTHAARDHKHVLVVFGANWCYDCHVLDAAFRSAEIAPLLEANYEVVHVDIGKGDHNQDIMQRYGVPLEKGIPALAVLEGEGKLLYSQRNGEFEAARSLGPEDLIAFLNRWKPDSRQK